MSWIAERITSYRLRGIAVLAGVVALLGLAIWLDPIRLEQRNSGYPLLKPCGFLRQTGYPCPTCYMTRSFVYIMHGRPDRAFWIQPFGAALCLLVIHLGWGAARVLITGRPWRPIWANWRRKYLILILIVGFLGAWIFRLLCGRFITGEFPLR